MLKHTLTYALVYIQALVLCPIIQHSNSRVHSRLRFGFRLRSFLSWMIAYVVGREQLLEHGMSLSHELSQSRTLYPLHSNLLPRAKHAISVLTITLLLGACSNSVRDELDRMTLLRLNEAEVLPMREYVRTKFMCPQVSTYAYFVGELNLSTNATRVGLRCQ
jgi:hypothetical protein